MIEEMLRENKLKVTPKRISIYNFLASTTSHPTAEEVYNQIKEEHPSMSLATVYKTLDTFSSKGMILEINTNLGYSRYDANTSLHAHLFCNECQTLVDGEMKMSNNDLMRKVKNQKGFKLENVKLLICGTCEECSKK